MWFRVDDKLHSHLKVSRVRRSDPEKVRDIAPMGLWVLAGSWSSAYNTGGFVPTEQLLEWDDNAEVYADRLAKAGLWVRAVQDGHEGYKFHDWADLNPLNSSASGSFGNHLRWHVNRNLVEADCAHCQSSGRVAPDIAPDSGQRRGESSTQPNPTQPNPTQPNTSISVAEAPEAATKLDEFESWWKEYPRREGSNPKKPAQAAYLTARKKVAAERLLDAVRALAKERAGQDPRYTPQAVTWLRQARWNAEPPPDTRDPYANLPNARDLPEPEDHPFDPPEWMAEKLAELEAKRAAS